MSEMDLEAAFTPHPGSSRDAVNKMAVAEAPRSSVPAPAPRSPKPVKVQRVAAPDGIYRTLVLQPGQPRQLIPQDPNRRGAHVIAVDGPIILAETQGLAQSVNNVSAAASSGEVIPAEPEAGASYTYTVPAACQLQSAAMTLTTSATVASRFAQLRILDASGNLIAGTQNGTATVASETLNISWVQGLGSNASAAQGTVGGAVPTIPLQAGWQIELTASPLESSDQISNIVLTFTASAPAVPYPDGLWLPQNVRLPIENHGLSWAVNPGSSAVRVSVLTERYDPA